MLFFLQLLEPSQLFEVVHVALQGLLGRIDIVVFDTIFLTGLLYDGSDFRVVGLDDPRKEMMGGLVVESTRKDRPEPATSGVVLRRGNLKLCPGNSTNLQTKF